MISRSSVSKTSVGPTFINIGPGRCATSWLHEIFLAHPEITMATVKETEFFNNNFEKGTDWYHSLFKDEGNSVAGEISNCYYTEPDLIQRIWDYSPDMKIIINVRDPFGLLKSFHGFGIRRGIDLGPLEESLEVPIGRLMSSGFQQRERRQQLTEGDKVTMLDAVRVSKFVEPVLARFPKENVYIFIFERLKTEQEQVIREMYDFVGADNQFVPPVAQEVINAAITPKSKWVARLATNVAYLLRSVGAYKLLSRLHQSRVVKKVFYKETGKSEKTESDPRKVLDARSRELLEQEIKDMMALHPPLKQWWEHLVAVDHSTYAADSSLV